MIRNDKIFYRVLLGGLVLCVALYVEEAVHFIHFGWNDPDNIAKIGDVSKCQPVAGSSTDFECPVRGYGMARYRISNHKETGAYKLDFIERIQ